MIRKAPARTVAAVGLLERRAFLSRPARSARKPVRETPAERPAPALAKVRRWRGAVFADAPDSEVRTWLVAARR